MKEIKTSAIDLDHVAFLQHNYSELEYEIFGIHLKFNIIHKKYFYTLFIYYIYKDSNYLLLSLNKNETPNKIYHFSYSLIDNIYDLDSELCHKLLCHRHNCSDIGFNVIQENLLNELNYVIEEAIEYFKQEKDKYEFKPYMNRKYWLNPK